MKVTLPRSELLSGIQLVQTAAEKKSTMPILANVLITASEGNISIASTDLEITSTATLPATVKTRGSTTINARIFLDIVKELPEGEVALTLSENERLEIACQRSRFKVNGVSSEEYPGLPGMSLQASGKVLATELSQMIDKTLYAVSADETRFNLSGVCFEAIEGDKKNEKSLRLVATDGHRLSLITRPFQGLKLKERVIVPRRGLIEVKKLLDTVGDVQVGLALEEGFLVIESPKYRLAVRLIEGEFPDYTQVIPQGKGVPAVIETGPLNQALRRVVLLATDKTKCIKLDFSSENLKISSSSPELGEAREELPVTYKGKDISVGFNARYLLDFLGSVGESKEMTIELHGELGPGRLLTEEDDGYLAIIMPMRIT